MIVVCIENTSNRGCTPITTSYWSLIMAFELPALPYDFAALEPHIDARTMEIHHGKHHAAYVAKGNAALEGTALAELTCPWEACGRLQELPADKQTAGVIYQYL